MINGLSLADMTNESDVEQKLLTPLIVAASPIGLGYDPSDFRTKHDIREFCFGPQFS